MAAATARTATRSWSLTLVLGTTAAALGLVTLRTARTPHWFALGDGSGTQAAVAVAAGWALVTAGLWTLRRSPGNRVGLLATAAGFASFAPGLMGWGGGPAVLFTAALLLSPLAVPLALHVALAYPSGRVESASERAALTLAYADAVVLWPALVLFTDPADDGCFLCSQNLVGFLRDRFTVEKLATWSAWLALAYSASIIVLVGRRALASSHARRVLIAPVLGGGIAVAVVQGVASVDEIRSGFQSFGPEDNALFLAGNAAFGLIAPGLFWGFVSARRTRASVRALVAQLGDTPIPGTLRTELARRLHDPTLALAYWLPERGQFVDPRGSPTEVPKPDGARAITEVRRGATCIAAVVHDPLVQLEPGLVEELGDSLRLAVEHERLQATVSAQLQELRASRAHIVAVGDAERRQLERDLHDGAQQRLLSLGLALQLADAGGGAGPEAKPFIVQAQLELQAAHTELRELGHGIHPAVLTDDGLAPALATLAERAPVPLVVRGVPPDRLPEPIELTAYLLAAEAVTDAADRPGSVVAVGIGQDGNRVTVDVESDGIDGVVAGRPGLEAIADRVAALDGSLHVWTSADGHGHMRAELPDTRSAP